MAHSKEVPVVFVCRTESFCASHLLRNKNLSDEENAKLFSKCNNSHGHNYRVTVTAKGPVDKVSGMVLHYDDLKSCMQKAFLSVFDHKNIDEDVSYFKDVASTGENLIVFIWKRLDEFLPKGLLYEVKMDETDKNTFVYRGEYS